MALESFLRPWSGWGYRHIPLGARYDVLDFRYAGVGAVNRWNLPGEPTLYLASDRGVALAEFARHLRDERSAELLARTVAREVFRLQVSLDSVMDLHDREVLQELSLRDAPASFLDRGKARAVANFVRQTTDAQALLVPSVAFLDDIQRCILVLFLDKLPVDPHRYVLSVVREAVFRVEELGSAQ